MTTSAPAPVQVDAPASLWEDFVDIYVAPSQVFARRRDGRFAPALVVLTLVVAALSYVLFVALAGAFEADLIRGIEASGTPPGEMPVEAIRSMARTGAIIGSIVTFPIGVAVTGLITLLVSRAFGAAVTFAVATTIATYAAFPRVFGMLSGILQGVLMEPRSMSSVSLGPARFLSPDTASPLLVALLGRLDLTVLWSVVLLAIGVQVAGGLRRSEAYLVAGIVWAVVTLPVLLPALLR